MWYRRTLAVAVLCLASSTARGADCNSNGVEDEAELTPFHVGFANGFLTAGSIAAIATGDFDRDGDADVAVANAGETDVHILWNLGGGRLGPPDRATDELLVLAMEAPDLNGDGWLDLAAVDFLERRVAGIEVVLNEGAGKLDRFLDPFPGQPSPGLAVADLDRDGDVDFAVTLSKPSGFILLWQEGGRFHRSTIHSLDLVPMGVAAADFDGDFDQDLAFAAAFAVVAVRFEDAAPAGEPQMLRVGSNPVSIRAGDMDADGDVDLCSANTVASLPGNVSVFLNDGRGVFAPPRNFAAGQGTSTFELADLDHDGALDAAVPSPAEGAIRMLLNDGKGTFTEEATFDIRGVPVAAEATDFDGDGRTDLCVADDKDGAILFLVNEGSRRFRWHPLQTPPSVRIHFGENTSPGSFSSADLDRDGDLDLTVSYADGIGIIANSGTGDLSLERTLVLDPPHAAAPTRLAAAELDGDGSSDLAVLSFTGKWARVLRMGDDDFAVTGSHDFPENPSCLAISDVDGDGDLDLTAGSYDLFGAPAFGNVLKNDGKGSLTGSTRFPTAEQPLEVASADVDRDGDADMVFASLLEEALVVHRNGGQGTFGPPELLPARGIPWNVTAADLDQDGALDLVAPIRARENSYDIALFWNRPEGLGEARWRGGEGMEARGLAVADFNGDSRPELAFSSSGQGRVAVHYDTERKLYPTDGIDAFALQAPDLDGDGNADLAVLHWGSHDLRVIFNQTQPPSGRDADGNGIPDDCDPRPFHRGDPNDDGTTDLADAIVILRHLFLGEESARCAESADIDNSGAVNVTDPIRLLAYLFLGGSPPSTPGPVGGSCGHDPDPHMSPKNLGCASYDHCS